jgi:hypothetical protein
MKPIDAILPALRKVTPRGSGWKACCPVASAHKHGDQTPSLDLGEGDDGRVLLKCYAGCSAQAIVEALGLTLRNLFPDDSRASGKGRKAKAPCIKTPEKKAVARSAEELARDSEQANGFARFPTSGAGVAFPRRLFRRGALGFSIFATAI